MKTDIDDLIGPTVEWSLKQATTAKVAGDEELEQAHLQTALEVAKSSPRWHRKVHIEILKRAIRVRSVAGVTKQFAVFYLATTGNILRKIFDVAVTPFDWVSDFFRFKREYARNPEKFDEIFNRIDEPTYTTDQAEQCQVLVQDLYKVFEKYPVTDNFCTFCHSEESIKHYKTTPIRQLHVEYAANLQQEAHDHWESTETYKHYLPRLLEIMAPPTLSRDSFAEQLTQQLINHGFKSWPDEERKPVLQFLFLIAEIPEIYWGDDSVEENKLTLRELQNP